MRFFMRAGMDNGRGSTGAEARAGTNGQSPREHTSGEQEAQSSGIARSRQHNCFGQNVRPNSQNSGCASLPCIAELISKYRPYLISVSSQQIVALKREKPVEYAAVRPVDAVHF